MKEINEEKLESDIQYRFGYVTEFIGITPEDIELIHVAKDLLAPVVPALVDAVYDKLNTYNCTWRHFIPRQHGYDGDIPEKLEDLKMDHPQIAFRKKHLTNYLVKLVSDPYDEKMVMYLDMVGKIHTKKAGNMDIYVPLVQMNALMGFVADAVNATIIGFDIDVDLKFKAIRAFGKLLWIQNDLITRHYESQ